MFPNSPEGNLRFAILRLTIADYYRGDIGVRNKYLKRKAENSLFKRTMWFIDELGLDVGYIRKTILEIQKNVKSNLRVLGS